MRETAVQGAASPSQGVERRFGFWIEAFRRFKRHRLAIAGLIGVLVIVGLAVFADYIAITPYYYADLSKAMQFPSWEHPLGTDFIGRDFFSRIVYGARTSMTVAIGVQAISVLIGVPLGLWAGFAGGRHDYIIMRLVEVVTALPGLLFALVLMSILGPGLFNVILAIGLTSWIEPCRLTRAQALVIKESDYVQVARALGAGSLHIMRRHLLPNSLGPLLVMVTLGIPRAVFAEAGLSFLGLGVNEPIPSWGKMVSEGMEYMEFLWHLGLFPTLMIAWTVLSFTLVGDGLRDAFDPRRG